MRRLLHICVLSMMVVACGSSSPSSESLPSTIVQAECVPSDENPTLGLSAVTDDFRVHVWNNKASSSPNILGESSDVPWESNDVYGLALAETIAVSTKDCSIFVGTCCEPVSGITYFQGKDSTEWMQLYGRLPTIDSGGELVARVVYEELVISSVATPDRTIKVVGLPSADSATIYKAQWMNDDEIILSGFTEKAAKLWVARMSDGTLREAATITTSFNWDSEDLSKVGLVGVDESGNVVVQNVNQNKRIVEFRYPESFEIFSTDEIASNVKSYAISQSRSVMVTEDGTLSTWFGNGNPKILSGKFLWAG